MKLYILSCNPIVEDNHDQSYQIGVYTNIVLALKEYYKQLDVLVVHSTNNFDLWISTIKANRTEFDSNIVLSSYGKPESVLLEELHEFRGL